MPTKAEQERVDSAIRHHIYIGNYGSGLASRILALFDNNELLALVSNKSNFRKKITAILKSDRKNAKKLLTEELRDLAKIEMDFALKMGLDISDLKFSKTNIDKIINDALNKPLVVTNNTPQDLYDAAFKRKEELALSLNSMANLGLKDISDINGDFLFAMSQFANSMKVANRTFSYSVSAEMRAEAYKKSNVVNQEVISAVLDGRTTPYCMDIDGTIFPEGEGPRPPFHPYCRTIAIPVIDGQTDEDVAELLSYRPQVLPGEEYEKGDNTKMRSTRKQINRGIVRIKPAGKKKKTGSNHANFVASQVHTTQGRQFIVDKLGVRRGNKFIRLINEGRNPDRALNEVLYKTDIQELDLKGLKKRS